MKKEIIEKIAIGTGVVFLTAVVMIFLILKKEKNDLQNELVIDEIKSVEIEEENDINETVNVEEESVDSKKVGDKKEFFEEVENLASLEKDIELREIEEYEDEKEEIEKEKKTDKKEEKIITDNVLKEIVKDKEGKSEKILFFKTYCQTFYGDKCTKYHTAIHSFDISDESVKEIYDFGDIGDKGGGFLLEPDDKKGIFSNQKWWNNRVEFI